MSGNNPLFDIERTVGRDIFGDDETRRLDNALDDLARGLDRADERLDDVVRDLRRTAEEAGIDVADVERRLREAAEDAEDFGRGDDDGRDDDDNGNGNGDNGNGNGDDNGGNGDGGAGNGGEGAAARTAFALVLPANNSGVLGFAAARLEGRNLDVQFVAANATPGEAHPLHIHGFPDGRPERLAVASDDADGDGFVETAEGAAAAFGPIIASLTASGEVDPALGGSDDFTVADEAGRIAFTRRYMLDPNEADDVAAFDALQARLEGRVIKLHGIEVEEGAGEGTPGEVNGDGGYVNLLPVAAGQFLFLPGLSGGPGEPAAQPEALLAGISAFLDALAPFTLSTDGSGALAADPFLAESDDATGNGRAEDDEDNLVGDDANGAAGVGGMDDNDGDGTDGDDNGDTGNADNGAGADGGAREFVALIQPANNSGVFGAARITFDEAAGRVTVDLDVAGLEPGRAHPLHIHGFADDRASLIPNITLDADLDGFVESSEGASAVGPVLLGLTADGSVTDAALIGDWAEADANGFLSLEQSYAFDLEDAGQAALFRELQDRMEGRMIQLHGLAVDAEQGEGTRGEVAGEAGFQPLLPIAHGAILATGTPGGDFAEILGGVIQDSLDAQRMAMLPDDTLIA